MERGCGETRPDRPLQGVENGVSRQEQVHIRTLMRTSQIRPREPQLTSSQLATHTHCRHPKYLLIKGKEVPLSKPPAEIYEMIEHGMFYDIGFMTGI